MRVTIPTLLGFAAVATATDCVSTYTICLDNGGADNTCESDNAKCKNVCADSYGTCLESGAGDVACMSQYNLCLDAFTVFSTRESSAGKDCVSKFSACHDDGTPDNTCNSYNAQCKDSCSTIYGTCLTSGGADSASCMTQYNNCLDSFGVFATIASSQGLDCVSSFSACHDNGTADNTCDAGNAQCKDKCSAFYGTCLSSGAADDAMCMTQYNNCLDSFTPSTSIDCVSSFTTCLDDGTEANTCASYSAQCKDKCSVSYSTCLSSGDADDAACLTQYSGCLVQFVTTEGSSDCVTKYTTCENSGTADNECSADMAVCKTNCATSYSTCLSSGDTSLAAPCLNQYNQCLVSFTFNSNTTASGQDCVSKYLSCGGDDNTCSASNAQCKNTCSTSLDACRSSGDETLTEECQLQYEFCLVDFTSVSTKPDCTSAYLECDGEDNECLADLAQCKNTCAVAYGTCNTSGDSALDAPCLKQYDSCLFSSTAATAAIGEDCVAEYLGCDDADNTCSAYNAQCKNKCGEASDTCNSSGDNSTTATCLHFYSSCLVSFSTNDTIPIGSDCASKLTICTLAGTADNVCNAEYAQCKNLCATAQDTCRSSGDETVVSMCDGLYNSCLDPVLSTNITTNATAAVNVTAMVNSTISSYVAPASATLSFNASASGTALANTTMSAKGAVAVVTSAGFSIPSAGATSASFVNATAAATSVLSTAASSGFALPTGSAAIKPYSNSTATSTGISSVSGSVLPTVSVPGVIHGLSTAVDGAAYTAAAEAGKAVGVDDETCDV